MSYKNSLPADWKKASARLLCAFSKEYQRQTVVENKEQPGEGFYAASVHEIHAKLKNEKRLPFVHARLCLDEFSACIPREW